MTDHERELHRVRNKRYREKHPGANAESIRKSRGKHPESIIKSNRKVKDKKGDNKVEEVMVKDAIRMLKESYKRPAEIKKGKLLKSLGKEYLKNAENERKKYYADKSIIRGTTEEICRTSKTEILGEERARE